jgi:hypothetical protein
MKMVRAVRDTLLLVCVCAATAAAATSRGSFDKPPYYHGSTKGALRSAHLTVDFRSEPDALDPTPDRSPALAALLDSLRTGIDRLGLTPALGVDVRLAGRPDVRFGCRRGGMTADGTVLAPHEIDTHEPRRMQFDVEGPSKEWKKQAAAAAGDSIRAIVSIQLGFDEYWVRQKDFAGNKSIELGTGRSQSVQWLTSLDDPVQVLQLTGCVVTPAGKVLRVGAEGILARRTGMVASMLGAQEMLTAEDLRLLTESHDGREPAWRTALRTLVARLLDGS